MNENKINEIYSGYKIGYKVGKFLKGKKKANKVLIDNFNKTTDINEKLAIARLLAELK